MQFEIRSWGRLAKLEYGRLSFPIRRFILTGCSRHVGKVIDLGGKGYPCRYTTTAEFLIPRITDRPPGARINWLREAGDVITDKWEGKTAAGGAAVAQCRLDEWLLVEAWDES